MIDWLLVKAVHRLYRRYSLSTCMQIGKEIATYPAVAFYATVLYLALFV